MGCINLGLKLYESKFLEFEVLRDSGITDSGLSQFMKVVQALQSALLFMLKNMRDVV